MAAPITTFGWHAHAQHIYRIKSPHRSQDQCVCTPVYTKYTLVNDIPRQLKATITRTFVSVTHYIISDQRWRNRCYFLLKKVSADRCSRSTCMRAPCHPIRIKCFVRVTHTSPNLLQTGYTQSNDINQTDTTLKEHKDSFTQFHQAPSGLGCYWPRSHGRESFKMDE